MEKLSSMETVEQLQDKLRKKQVSNPFIYSIDIRNEIYRLVWPQLESTSEANLCWEVNIVVPVRGRRGGINSHLQ